MTYPTEAIFYSTAGNPPFIPDQFEPSDGSNEPYLDWLRYILALPDSEIPQTISNSYADDEQTVPKPYATTVCNLFAQLGARGVSVLFGSGDSGPGGECISNDGKNRTVFTPMFPASCPWVTAVGGTQNIPEIAIDFSGGGFSNYFSRPSYQKEDVCSYLAINSTWNQYYNSAGRAYPDVAAYVIALNS